MDHGALSSQRGGLGSKTWSVSSFARLRSCSHPGSLDALSLPTLSQGPTGLGNRTPRFGSRLSLNGDHRRSSRCGKGGAAVRLASCALCAGLIALLLLVVFGSLRFGSGCTGVWPWCGVGDVRDSGGRARGVGSGRQSIVWAPRVASDGLGSSLVVYVYLPEEGPGAQVSRDNLDYFLAHGLWDGDGCEYLFVMPQSAQEATENLLATLPPNARYVTHDNVHCHELGVFGWAVSSGHLRPEAFKHVIVASSAVRGPFLPAFVPAGWHWSHALTQRLNERVKLVGATITCAPGHASDASLPLRQLPHVPSHVMAMDQVGYHTLARRGSVFRCYPGRQDSVYYSELGGALALLQAGYTLDSLMLRYQGVDWRNVHNWNCNEGLDPHMADAHDGINLNPLEVLFVEVRYHMLELGWETAVAADKYSAWQRPAERNVSHNQYVFLENLYRRMKTYYMEQKDPHCFDRAYYRQHNADLAQHDDAFLWSHFVHYGQFEPRRWRLLCDDKAVENDEALAAGVGWREEQHGA